MPSELTADVVLTMISTQSRALSNFDWELLLTVASVERVASAKKLAKRFPSNRAIRPRAREVPSVERINQDARAANATIDFGETDGRVTFRFLRTEDGWRISETVPLNEPWHNA